MVSIGKIICEFLDRPLGSQALFLTVECSSPLLTETALAGASNRILVSVESSLIQYQLESQLWHISIEDEMFREVRYLSLQHKFFAEPMLRFIEGCHIVVRARKMHLLPLVFWESRCWVLQMRSDPSTFTREYSPYLQVVPPKPFERTRRMRIENRLVFVNLTVTQTERECGAFSCSVEKEMRSKPDLRTAAASGLSAATACLKFVLSFTVCVHFEHWTSPWTTGILHPKPMSDDPGRLWKVKFGKYWLHLS